MSRQTHSKKNVTTVAFLLIIVSIGFPFQNLDIPTNVNINFTNDLAIINFILGNGLVGKSIFDSSTYTTQVAHATHSEDTHAINGTEPVITLLGDNPQNLSVGDGYTELGATASDPSQGDLTSSIVVDSSQFNDRAGEYEIFYLVNNTDQTYGLATRDVVVTGLPTNDTGELFNEATYQTVEEAILEGVELGRTESEEVLQIGDNQFVTSSGLTRWIQDNDGEYVERLVYDTVDGVQFESGVFTYYYDKNACGMTIYDVGRVTESSELMIKYNGWVAKSALNGTDTWTDLPQNSLPCTVTVIDNENETVITSVKSDDNGVFTETYQIPKPIKAMKTTLTFLNNNTSLNDHKIAFTNILDATPQHYRVMLVDPVYYTDPTDNSTQYYEMATLKEWTTSPNSVPLGYANATFIPNGQSIDIPVSEFHLTKNVNMTITPLGLIPTDTGFSMDYYSENKAKWIPIRYEFTNDAMDKLWNVKIVNNQPTQNRILVDYMNINQITAVGETAILDPSVITSLSQIDIKRVSIGGTGATTGGGAKCGGTPSLAFTDVFSATVSSAGGLSNSERTSCNFPMLTFDLSSIPTDASIQQMDFSWSSTSAGANNGLQFSQNRWYMGIGEDVTALDGFNAGNTIYGCATCNGLNLFSSFLMNGLSGGNPTPYSVTFLDPSTVTDGIETNIENGKDFVILSGCMIYGVGFTSFSTNGCSVGFRQAAATNNFWVGDESTINLDITWEIFVPASAPQDLTCLATSTTNLFLDWNVPLDTGGALITGYQIERSTGGAFQIIEASISPVPTEYNDPTVFAGIQFTYRVSTVTDFGAGAFAEITCGVAGDPDEPLGLTAQNQALGIVALDWSTPVFTGNTEITGYQIDRTTGTPDTDDTWDFVQHFTGNLPNFAGEVRICTIAESCGGTGGSIIGGVTQFDGLWLTTGAISGGGNCQPNACRGNVYLFKDFLVEELINRKIEINYEQYKRAAGFSFQGFGEWETKMYIADGVFDLSGTNQVGGAGEFAQGKAGTEVNAGLMHVPDVVGNGLLFDCFDNWAENPSQVTVGGLPDNVSLPFLSQQQGFGTHTGFCIVDDLSLAQQPRVTLIFAIRDQQSGLIGCGSNCASSGSGAVNIDFINIEGVGFWDYHSILPTETIITFNDPPPNDIANQFGTVQEQRFVIGDGFITLVDDTLSILTEFLDTTVAELTTYGYRVFAINIEGLSDQSNVAIVTTAGSPDVVATPTVTPTGTQTINVSWVLPELNGGTLDFFELERKTGLGGIFQSITTVVSTGFDDGEGLFTLLPDQEYCYRVQIFTNIGSSASFSNEACATTFDAPDKVENHVVTALDGSRINMSFEDPLSDGGSPITGFKVERKIGAGAFITLDEATFIQFRNDTGLPIGTLIQYKVTASNQFGLGDSSTEFDTTDATPQAPPNFSCSASSSSSLTLNWETPQTFSPPTGYQIDKRAVGGSFSTLVGDTASTAVQFLDDGLVVDSIFEYRVRGHTTEGDTDFTPIIRCTTLSAPDFPPEDFQGDFTQTIPHQMVLAWDIPDTFGIPITSFRIERDDGAGYNEIASVSSSSFIFIDEDPSNSISQKYRVFTVGSEGDSAPSIAVPFSSNQVSHWHYEKTIDDTGDNKNAGFLVGTANFDNTGINGLGFLFGGSTYITVSNEEDYDHDNNDSLGITTYYRGNSTGTTQALVTKANTFTSIGYSMFIDSTGVLGVRILNTATSNELHVLGSTNVTDNSLHFLGFGYDGNNDEGGLSLMVDGLFETKNVITNTLSNTILNNNDLTIGAYDNGSNLLSGLLDDTRFFGTGTLDNATLQAVATNSINTVIPINATITIGGTVFADISRETPLILMTSGYPLPTINTIDLNNFTATTVNTQTVGLVIDGATGQFILDPALFNTMSSLSNYTAVTSLTNSEETFPLLSNFDIQVPLFTFTGDFFFQQQRNDDFTILSFNYTQTDIPFDLACNFKSALFEDGETVEFNGVFFVEHLQPVPFLEDVVVACIDQNTVVLDPTAPSFGGSNSILSFVSFGDTTGVGNFLQFTNNYGDFFGVGLPFLFIIILAAAFTGRSAPTGILIIGIAIGIMWAMGIIDVDPFMWGIIIVLIILGVLGGKKFL